MYLFWLAVILILSFIEIGTINLVSIWFVASALVSLLLSFLPIPFYIQFIVFVVLGIVLLITTRKSLEEFLSKTKQKTNLDRVVGMQGIVTEKISKNNPGEVKVDGKRWTAVSDKTIDEGKTVEIMKIEGVKLIVKEV